MKTSVVLAFAFAALSLLGAKSFDVTLSEPSTIGGVQLAAGHYSVKVDASTVHFKNLETGKTADVTGKIGTAVQKFESTSTTYDELNGVAKVKELDLGGTTTKIEFE